MVFHCQLEVGKRDGDEGCHNDKDDEYEEQNGVDGVHLVPPHAGEDVVQLNVDGAEGQEACTSMQQQSWSRTMNLYTRQRTQ